MGSIGEACVTVRQGCEYTVKYLSVWVTIGEACVAIRQGCEYTVKYLLVWVQLVRPVWLLDRDVC
jgi:hypothetical protein